MGELRPCLLLILAIRDCATACAAHVRLRVRAVFERHAARLCLLWVLGQNNGVQATLSAQQAHLDGTDLDKDLVPQPRMLHHLSALGSPAVRPRHGRRRWGQGGSGQGGSGKLALVAIAA